MIQRILIFFLIAVGVGLIGLSAQNRDPIILYNPTESAPIGWYKIIPTEDYAVGDLVAARLPIKAKNLAVQRGYLPQNIPVIKTVMAGPNDRYCIKNGELIVGEILPLRVLPFDSKGREMPVLPEGCRSLSDRSYLLTSNRVSVSFDSRYFGPVEQSQLLGRVQYLGEDVSSIGWMSRYEGGARGLGAECKIKGISAKRGVTPCLHINFYGAIWRSIALRFFAMPNMYWCIGQRQFPIVPDLSLDSSR